MLDNNFDYRKKINKFPNLFDSNFQAKIVDNIWDILNEVLLEKIDWVRFD